MLLFLSTTDKVRTKENVHICECQCNERLKPKTDLNTGSCGDLEHLKIETRLIDESFECLMGECVI